MRIDQYTLFVILSPIGCAIAFVIAVYGWRRQQIHAARPLALAMSAVTAYLIFNTLELVDPTPQGTLFFAQACYICISVLTVNWLAFALTFSDHENWMASKDFRWLWVIPAITIVLVFTNWYHHLIWEDYTFIPVGHGFLYMHVITYGVWFWVFWLHSFTLILAGAALLVWTSIKLHRQFRMQARLIVAAGLLPLIVNLTYVLHLIPGLNKDYSPLSYAFTGILLAVSIFRFHLLDLTPFARATLIDSMSDGMLTLDPSRCVVDYNPAALRIFAAAKVDLPCLGKALPLLDEHMHPFESVPSPDLVQTELVLPNSLEEGYYDLQIRRLHRSHGAEAVGYLVLMHAINEHKRLLQAVRKLAEEDTLTGVLNRSRFFELANREIISALKGLSSFSVLMIDIDHFKQANDSLGHVGGDQLLYAFAQRLYVWLRSTDLIGRIGGDEFIVLLPQTNLADAYHLAERLCYQVAAGPLETKDYGAFPVTISVGVAEYSRFDAGSLKPVLLEADKGLYQAKELGRNRVCIFDPVLGVEE